MTDSPKSITIPKLVDTTAPTVPTSLTATAVSTSQINLSWTASTDNIGVTGYKVYRNGSLIATTTPATSYQDTGLNPNTPYSYTVSAYDAAGNNSAQSTSKSATTLAVVVNIPPIGSVDVANGTSIVGWTLDPDAPTESLAVHIYRDGPAGQGTMISSFFTDILRTDVNVAYATTGNHGFSIAVSSINDPILKDGQPHALYFYGINTPTGDNPQLFNSPKTITVPRP